MDASPDTSRQTLDITTAAFRLGISPDGVRKRISRGSLQGYKAAGQWHVILDGPDSGPDSGPELRPDPQDGSPDELDTKDTLIKVLQDQIVDQRQQLIAREREVQELLTVVRQAQAMLPAPKVSGRHWWRLWHR